MILDGNLISAHVKFPPIGTLHTLWLNSNEIDNTAVLLDHLVEVCPNLQDLSLLKNPACLNYFSGGTPAEYRDYRLYIINRMTNLRILDGSPIKQEEYAQSAKLYGSVKHSRTPTTLNPTGQSSSKTFQETEEVSVPLTGPSSPPPAPQAPPPPPSSSRAPPPPPPPQPSSKPPSKSSKTPPTTPKSPSRETLLLSKSNPKSKSSTSILSAPPPSSTSNNKTNTIKDIYVPEFSFPPKKT
uniref:U2A'/phosphoprotein 32 family A C-terminal domain-containing protein n=1 Tax=Arcella intermedia TaxID=1963864 RepID=A0A6B2LCW4_9EUKA